MRQRKIVVTGSDGAHFELLLSAPEACVHWLYFCPAMGVSARQYRLLADALTVHGIGLATHEWRGIGSSNQRASRRQNWSYRQLLDDVEAGVAALRQNTTVDVLMLGGHSLGAQIGLLALARNSELADAGIVIGSGMPWWRCYPSWQQPLLFLVFAWFRAVSSILGWFPGRRIGFAGDEARGVIRDWAQSGLRGRYQVTGMDTDLDAALRRVAKPIWAAWLQDDRYVPQRALLNLAERLPAARWTIDSFQAQQFENRQATHFSWMKEPAPISAALVAWFHDQVLSTPPERTPNQSNIGAHSSRQGANAAPE